MEKILFKRFGMRKHIFWMWVAIILTLINLILLVLPARWEKNNEALFVEYSNSLDGAMSFDGDWGFSETSVEAWEMMEEVDSLDIQEWDALTAPPDELDAVIKMPEILSNVVVEEDENGNLHIRMVDPEGREIQISQVNINDDTISYKMSVDGQEINIRGSVDIFGNFRVIATDTNGTVLHASSYILFSESQMDQLLSRPITWPDGSPIDFGEPDEPQQPLEMQPRVVEPSSAEERTEIVIPRRSKEDRRNRSEDAIPPLPEVQPSEIETQDTNSQISIPQSSSENRRSFRELRDKIRNIFQ